MNDRDQDKRLDGPDMLSASVYGDNIDALKLAALDEARKLYGPDVPLQIEEVWGFRTSTSSRGAFHAYVTVRCLQIPEGW